MPTYIRTVKFSRWFPYDDPLAVKIARLCIIQADLVMEARNLHESRSEPDEFERNSRGIYSFRNFVRILQEFSSTVNSLAGDEQFQRLVNREDKSTQEEFKRLIQSREKAASIIKDVRNDICGHIKQKAVEAALQKIADEDPDSLGILEVTPDVFKLNFVQELIAGILLKDVSKEERETATSRKYAEIQEFLHSLSMIQQSLLIYLKYKGFFD